MGTEEREEKERGTMEREEGLRTPLKDEGIDKEWEKTRLAEELGEMEALGVEKRRAVEAAAEAIDGWVDWNRNSKPGGKV